MTELLKTAVIGVGHLGKEHARIFNQLQDTELCAVVDTNEKQRETIAKKQKTKGLADYHELLGKVDAVSIASPTSSHYEIARDFLKAKTHVLVEKPMTDSLETAEELVKLAKEQNVKLQVGHIERFNPAVMEIIKRNLRPVYIEAMRISPFRFRSGDVSVVLDLMIHDIDIISMLANSPIEKADAVGINLLGHNEDIANARLSFECGCIANVTASRASLKSLRQIRIFSPNTYVSLDYGKMKGKIFRIPEDLDLEKINFQKAVPKRFLGIPFEELFFGRLLDVEKISMKAREPLLTEIESFVKCIREDTRPIVPGEDGARAIKIAHMVIQDIKKNLEKVKKCVAEEQEAKQ